eukprot:11103290-Heterocapsa_arctica.AAC.1
MACSDSLSSFSMTLKESCQTGWTSPKLSKVSLKALADWGGSNFRASWSTSPSSPPKLILRSQ